MSLTDLDAPRGIAPDGRVPSTRMQDAKATQARVQRLLNADTARSKRRAQVKGLVDGNPPYKRKTMKDAGRSDQCNVNWRIAESYLHNAQGAFYDVYSESSAYASIELDHEDAFKQAEWSGIVSEEFDRMQKEDRGWDFTVQNSQYEMVLYGKGPLAFTDNYDWRCKSVANRDLLVPDAAMADVCSWDEMAILCDYSVAQLYSYIRGEAASKMGWNVSATRKAIINSHPKAQDGGQYQNWEWHQEQLKTRSMDYSAESSVVRVAHYYVREFPDDENPDGAITHCIVMSPKGSAEPAQSYLYQQPKQYETWEQIIHPMYYDNLGGGRHDAVTGMGVKMFSAMEYQNRLLCNLADKAFAPKVFFKPTSGAADQALNVVKFTDYGKVPAGFDIVPQVVHGLIEEGLVLNREIGQTVAANLSSYRQNLESKDGNPRTATEVQVRASEQARLGKTQLARYYTQLDWLYAEKYRRAVNTPPTGGLPGSKAALEFIKRCQKRGVPLSALKKVRRVSAVRVVGQGSEFMRQASLEFLLGILGLLPESGRQNLIADVIASRAGQNSVNRYFPRQHVDPRREDQIALAMLQVASMKEGVPAVVTQSQEHLLFCEVFLNAAAESFNTVGQGGNPAEVLRFVELAGQAIAQHLEAMRGDSSRSKEVAEIEKQLKKLGQMADKLKQDLAKAQEEQGEGQQAERQTMGEEELKNFQAMQEEERRNLKLQQDQVRKDFKLQNQIEQSRIMTAEKLASQRSQRNGE